MIRSITFAVCLALAFPLLAAPSSLEDSSLSKLYREALAEGGEDAAAELRGAVGELCGNTGAVYSVQLWALSNYLYAEQKKGLPIPVRIIPVEVDGEG